jgi:hypothetical protein
MGKWGSGRLGSAPSQSRLAALRFLVGAIGVCALGLTSATSLAARIAVISNSNAAEVAADFGARLTGHSFTPIDVSISVPAELSSLVPAYDALLVFEDDRFANAKPTGDLAAAFAATGRPVVVGSFYDKDRSDAGGIGGGGYGWGNLELIDPNTTDGLGIPAGGQIRTLNPARTVRHPLTEGVTSLFAKRWAGGNEAKPGTRVVAEWQEPNYRGHVDPAIAYRITGNACVIQIGIIPHYPSVKVGGNVPGTDFGGDYYVVWRNAFDFAGQRCGIQPSIPTLSDAALAALMLAVAALGWRQHRRSTLGG